MSPNGGSDTCGLGWQVTERKSLLGTSTRGTTNSYLSPTWSMTTGTSGCEKHELAKNDVESVKYLASNFHSIKADMAEGQGEYLSGLARLMGCDDPSVSHLQTLAQKNYQSITGNSDAYETLQKVKNLVRQDANLMKGCSSVIL